jgi:hypothetical protein
MNKIEKVIIITLSIMIFLLIIILLSALFINVR